MWAVFTFYIFILGMFPFRKPECVHRVATGGSMLQGCNGVYIDLGSNLGVQIRKLFEPERYPGAAVIPIFDKYFGNNRSRICAVGFEPNPVHTVRLNALQEHYSKHCGHRVHFFTETAVSNYNGNTVLWSDNKPDRQFDGSSITTDWNNMGLAYKVRVIDIAEFIKNEVLPYTSNVVMKVDIEGSENYVVPHLLMQGVFCSIDAVFMEMHAQMIPADDYDALRQMMSLMPQMVRLGNCNVTFQDLDDESYAADVDNSISTCGTGIPAIIQP